MFGKILADLRAEKKLTQKELAEKLNVSSGAIGMYETEKRKLDSDKLLIFCNFFDVSVDYLLGRTDIRNFNTHQHTTPILTPEQQMLLNLYNSLNDLNKGAALERIKVLLESQEEKMKQEQATELGIYKKNA